MAERFELVFTQAENLYTEGSPVLITDSWLRKDNLDQTIAAGLRLKNIGVKPIRAVTVRLKPLDPADRPLGEALSFDFLDLNAGRDEEFGQQTAIHLPNSSTRAFTAAVTEVIFADKSTWSAPEGAVWAPLPAPETPEHALGDAELVKQYLLRFGADTVRMPASEKDLWFCACGAVNHADEETCHHCGKARGELLAFDPEELKAARDQRLARERAAREAAEKKAAEQKAEAERLVAEKKAAAQAKAKKVIKTLAITLSIAALLVGGFFLTVKVLIPNSRYQIAQALADAGEYEKAISVFQDLGGYKDSPMQVLETKYRRASALAEAGRYDEAIAAFQALGNYPGAREQVFALWGQITQRETVSAGVAHTVGLRADGTVVAVGDNEYGQCEVSGWTDIVAVSAGARHTVGLLADGTVVAAGSNEYGQCDVSGWTDIVAVSAGWDHTVGLRADGTVVAVGYNDDGQCEVSGWTDVVAVSAGGSHSVGLRADGTVMAAGSIEYGRCDVSDWQNVVAVSAGFDHTVGLLADGTVVATGWDVHVVGSNSGGQCDVSGWRNVVAISAGYGHTVGLLADGTVVATGWNYHGQCDVSGWTDIVAVSAGSGHTMGLRSDGTVVATKYTGNYDYGQCNVGDWRDIKLPN
jgi:alpha-tubulin suppressor-like RCC1 family protein